MSSKTTVVWTDGLSFDAELQGHHIVMDASPEFGGRDLGPTPKPLLLVALGGCTGMDVASMLTKMNAGPFTLRIEVDGESSDTHPKVYTEITVHYILTGENVTPEKARKAVRLSETQYCGVMNMLNKVARITTRITINGSEAPHEA
jgi:putative redox protein